MLTRRRFIQGIAGGLVTVGGGLAYVSQVEPRWLTVSRFQVPLAKADHAVPLVRVLHLSDLHLSSEVSLEFISKSIDLGLANQPDLIALTGDFFTGRPRDLSAYATTLQRLSASVPTFACLGNHDGGPWAQHRGGPERVDAVVRLLSDAGITCLNNDSRMVSVRDRAIQLIGVGDLWSGMCKPQIAFTNAAPRDDAVRLLLNHNPDAKELLRRYDWDVMLCGHTHGGQVRLPVIGTPYAPVRDKRYVHGLYSWDDRWLHVTSGVGNLHGVRFNCRPEVSVLTLG
jgi:predicted MPP superfamily phosphohydrolase